MGDYSEAYRDEIRPKTECRPQPDGDNRIAVISLGCRFPQADTPDEFWKLISNARKAKGRTIPPSRFEPRRVPDRGRPSDKYWGVFLDDVDAFDHRFFGMSGREAEAMDPQQRLALQVAYETLESAGYFGSFAPRHGRPAEDRDDFPEKDDVDDDDENSFGCYLGVQATDYEHNVGSDTATAFSAVGTIRSFISGRISHFLGWKGPSVTVDTACSASAVAIHMACQAILSGEVSMALAGGVNVITEVSFLPIVFFLTSTKG